MLAMLGIYMLLKGVLKVQYYSSISLDFVLSVAVTLSLTLICMLAILVIPICINASRTSFILILIYILAMLDIYMFIKGVLKVQYYSFISLDLVLSAATTLWP